MSKKARKVLAIIALCIMPVFVVSITLALGFSDILGGSMPAVAGVSGCLVLLIFVFLKMDANRTEAKLAQAKLEQSLQEGAQKLEEDIANGTAIDVTDQEEQAQEDQAQEEQAQENEAEEATDENV